MILITGANGFIGRNLAKFLAERGDKVLATSRNPDEEYFKGLGCVSAGLDVTNKEDFHSIRQDISAIVHLASPVPSQRTIPSIEECIKTSGLGTLNVLGFSQERKIPRFVYISSSMVNAAAQSSPVDEKQLPEPYGKYAGYGIGKRLGELISLRFSRDCAQSVICLRLAMVYGAGQKAHLLIPRLIRCARESGEIKMYGAPGFLLDLCYIKDAIAAIALALESKCQGIYNIATGSAVSLAELADLVSEVFAQGQARITFDPIKEPVCGSYYLDISQARKELGYQPSFSLRAGLLEMKRLQENE